MKNTVNTFIATARTVLTRFVLVALLSLSAVGGYAKSPQTNIQEKEVWAFSIDNDLFIPGTSEDVDFTGGLAFTYTGKRGEKYWNILDNTLASVDQLSRIGDENSSITPSIEFGVYGFTPEVTGDPELVENDRPYASMVYLSASRIYQEQPGGDAWFSSLTIGALGLDWFGDIQNNLHKVINNDQAQGWNNQISDGGEATFRYQLAYQDYWERDAQNASQQFKTTYFASVGYLTELGVAISSRHGLISSPSSRFNPELISYGERVNEVVATPAGGKENYLWGGIAIKARLYNAFLQGQFKHSEHVLARDELRPLLVEAWAGYTLTIGREFKFSYVIRGQSSEIRSGDGNRHLLWGGLMLSQTI